MMLVSMSVIQLMNELRPYTSLGANRLAVVCQWCILFVCFLGLLLRISLDELDASIGYDKASLITIMLIIVLIFPLVFGVLQKRKYFISYIRRMIGLRRLSAKTTDVLNVSGLTPRSSKEVIAVREGSTGDGSSVMRQSPSGGSLDSKPARKLAPTLSFEMDLVGQSERQRSPIFIREASDLRFKYDEQKSDEG